jgi:glycosyltransferase involved in cell wall biosynthesis
MSEYKLTVMVLSLTNRLPLFIKLMTELEKQSRGLPVEILYLGDSKSYPIGQKRNMLQRYAQGEYSCWIDDDDFIPPYYIEEILKAIEHKPDVICWTNKVTVGGEKMIPHPSVNLCHFSIKYNPEINDTRKKIFYHRPCHVNPTRHDIVMKFPFKECSYCRADLDRAKEMVDILKSEYIIEKVMYYHRYGFYNDKGTAPKTGLVR